MNPYIQCMEKQKEQQEWIDDEECLSKVDRIEWYPVGQNDCEIMRNVLKAADQQGHKSMSYKILFMNERCRRLVKAFYKRD